MGAITSTTRNAYMHLTSKYLKHVENSDIYYLKHTSTHGDNRLVSCHAVCFNVTYKHTYDLYGERSISKYAFKIIIQYTNVWSSRTHKQTHIHHTRARDTHTHTHTHTHTQTNMHEKVYWTNTCIHDTRTLNNYSQSLYNYYRHRHVMKAVNHVKITVQLTTT